MFVMPVGKNLLGLNERFGAPELWGGVECTVNRIGDEFGDQLWATGHAERSDDVDRINNIGFAAVRYPVLWERIAPVDPEHRNWAWSDDRLAQFRLRGQRVIAGLVHHGSGPRYTNLLDPGFACGVAAHAAQVARRYPFIEDWTPINEPVTTARFSALYGHWYPHHRDERSFWLALLNQVDATRLAMRAVREVNAHARLIQTDDLGRTYATASMRDQAGFDNSRRWMSWDLLCGMVKPGHALWRRLCDYGFEDRLITIADDPCPPDVVGINHYLTSDRFLDHRTRRYPAGSAGRNASRAFVDTEAVRVLEPGPEGLSGTLREAWARYRLPIAVTEVHNGCTREEQMRWMWSAWQAAKRARTEGIDIRAVTSWALFGSAGWDTLLRSPGRYEAGAFDVSGDVVRETAMVPLLRALAQDREATHPVMQGEGWWQRGIRLQHPSSPRTASFAERRTVPAAIASATAAPVLIAGGDGTLGRALAAACRHRDVAYVALGRAGMNLLDRDHIAAALDRYRPWAVINAAGWVRVDEAEERAADCFAVNAMGAGQLGEACAMRGIQSVHFSSDLVFDGELDRAYDESDTPCATNVYGRSKAAAEQLISDLRDVHLIVRTAAFFSPFDEHNFAMHACRAMARGERFGASACHHVTLTYVPDLCNAVLDLAIDGERGIWHLTNGEACSWAEFARRLARATDLDEGLVEEIGSAELGWRAPRPRRLALKSRRGKLLPSLASAIVRFAAEWEKAQITVAPTPSARFAEGNGAVALCQ